LFFPARPSQPKMIPFHETFCFSFGILSIRRLFFEFSAVVPSPRVDLLAGLRGLDRLALSRSITVPFLGGSLRVIGREDFIAMKCFAGGHQDIADAVQALKTTDHPLDLAILRWTTRRFGRPQTCWRSCCGFDGEPPG